MPTVYFKKLPVVVLSCLAFSLTYSQTTILSEDFTSATGTTPPTGWTVQTVQGDPAVDIWRFDNSRGQPKLLNCNLNQKTHTMKYYSEIRFSSTNICFKANLSDLTIFKLISLKKQNIIP